MQHIRSSIDGIFFLQNNGAPTSTVTLFNEPIKDGSLCVDVNNDELYILRDGTWSVFTSVVGTSGAVDLTYIRQDPTVTTVGGLTAGTNDAGDIFDGEWHLITSVIDPVSQTSRIYVDGVIRDESEAFDLSTIALNSEPVVIGAETQENVNPFIGQMDDVRIWNYPLGEIDIVNLYLDFEEDKDVCMNQDDTWLQFDYAGEPGEPSYCRIDIADLAEFVSAWLECHLVPVCIP